MVGEMDVGEHHPPMERMGDARRPAGRNTTRSHEGGAHCVWTGQVSWRAGASSRSILHWHGLTKKKTFSGVEWCGVWLCAWVRGFLGVGAWEYVCASQGRIGRPRCQASLEE